MITFDANNGSCSIFTYKEGLLSRVAHDLELSVGSFEVEVDESVDPPIVRATFDTKSIRVSHAMSGGHPAPGALSAKDTGKIEANLASDVLLTKKYPMIEFTSTSVSADDEGFRLSGRLSLCGRQRQVLVRVVQRGDQRVAEASLHQPDFGIKPFSAMLGALKVKPDVLIRLTLDWPA